MLLDLTWPLIWQAGMLTDSCLSRQCVYEEIPTCGATAAAGARAARDRALPGEVTALMKAATVSGLNTLRSPQKLTMDVSRCTTCTEPCISTYNCHVHAVPVYRCPGIFLSHQVFKRSPCKLLCCVILAAFGPSFGLPCASYNRTISSHADSMEARWERRTLEAKPSCYSLEYTRWQNILWAWLVHGMLHMKQS